MSQLEETVAKFTEQLKEYGSNEPDLNIERFAPVLDAALGLNTLNDVWLHKDTDFDFPAIVSAGFSPIIHLPILRDAARRWTEKNGFAEAEKKWYIGLLRALHKHATYAGVGGNPRMARMVSLGLHEDTFDLEDALSCISYKYVDYLCGVAIKMRLDDPRDLDGAGYDRAHGEGLFKHVLSTLPHPPTQYPVGVRAAATY